MEGKGEFLMIMSLGRLLGDTELRLGFSRQLGFGEETKGIVNRKNYRLKIQKNLGWFGR